MTGRLNEFAGSVTVTAFGSLVAVETCVAVLDCLHHTRHIGRRISATLSAFDPRQELAVDVADLSLAQLLRVSRCPTRLPNEHLGRQVRVLVRALRYALAGELAEVVGVALRSRVHALLLTRGHAQVATSAAAVLLETFERLGLLELLDELHVVLKRVDFARVALGHARVVRRDVVRGAIMGRLGTLRLLATLRGHD